MGPRQQQWIEMAEEMGPRQQQWISSIVDSVNARKELASAQELTATPGPALLERLRELEDDLKAADARASAATQDLQSLQAVMPHFPHANAETTGWETRLLRNWQSEPRQRHAALMWLERTQNAKKEGQEHLDASKARAAAAASKREASLGVVSFATVNGCERFVHPLTGFELPEEVHFAPRSCILIDNNRASNPPRGVLYYLATGGGEFAGQTAGDIYINPGNREAWLAAMGKSIADLRETLEREEAEAADILPVLWDLETKILHTRSQVEEMTVQARRGLEIVKAMEEHLASVASRSLPMPGRIDDIRRAICKQRATVAATVEQARESQDLLRR